MNRSGKAGWHHVVLAASAAATAEAVMELGPTTIRPDESLARLVPRLREKHVERIIVTIPDGVLIGTAQRVAAEHALAAWNMKENGRD